MRIPQEDLCQATGTSPTDKYESDGGPGIERIMNFLLGSQIPSEDRRRFFTAQILYWLIAAPDGHAKNFSVFIERGGRFRLTPLYDIISAYPVMGHGAGMLPRQKLRMAMALSGKNRHYEWDTIRRRHFTHTARLCGFEAEIHAVLDDLLIRIPDAVSGISNELPADFPGAVADPIFEGFLAAADRLAEE